MESPSQEVNKGLGGNRLGQSRSPYLLQHADNPVDWYPWGEEAFAQARDEDKPVFLSIGYATCHWCHVMAHESFADSEVAAVLNRHFVAIKVDREERPDLDDQYMTVSQLLTGSGGWPLNLFLTPERQPFYAMTYLPKNSRDGMIGFMELLERVAAAWSQQRQRVVNTCGEIVAELRRLSQLHGDEPPGTALCLGALAHLSQLFDATHAGFGQGHKFPQPVILQFLLRFWRRTGEEPPLRMVLETLRAMMAGGIYDQFGGGFHRYAVDRAWQVPHFEKMLYDQALIAKVLLEAHQATGEPGFLETACATLAYLERDLASPEGGLYSAEDADSDGGEGAFYLWTPAEIRAVLGEANARLACQVWGIADKGVFAGGSLPRKAGSLPEIAVGAGITRAELCEQLTLWRQQLLRARQGRPRPLRDEKVLAEWNCLALAAFAKAYAVTGHEGYRVRAEAILSFVESTLVRSDGRLLRTWFRGEASVPAFLGDYAALLCGIVELHQVTWAPSLVASARRWADGMLDLFQLPSGALAVVGTDAEQLLAPTVPLADGVVPAGNALAASGLLRLAAITDDGRYATAGMAIVRACAGTVSRQPHAYLGMLQLVDDYGPAATVVTITGGSDVERSAWHRRLRRMFLPGVTSRQGVDDNGLLRAELCREGVCLPAITDLDILEQALASGGGAE